jgi:hypothetical protein
MEFGCNQIVVLRNGVIGVVACFNGRPFQLVFKSYTSPIGRYDSELKNKNNNYDVVEIFDGSTIENVLDVFKSKFTTEGLERIWKRDE